MITPLGTCLILSTTPYAPLPSSSISSKSSAFTTKFWTRGGKTLLHMLIMQNRNFREGASRRNASANFTWSPILTRAFESRSPGGLWGWESNTDLSWVLNKKQNNYELKWSVYGLPLSEAMWPLENAWRSAALNGLQRRCTSYNVITPKCCLNEKNMHF